MYLLTSKWLTYLMLWDLSITNLFRKRKYRKEDETIYKKIEKLVKEKGITIYRLAKDTGIPESSFSRWKSGVYGPSFRNIVKIANYFNVTLDYFL